MPLRRLLCTAALACLLLPLSACQEETSQQSSASLDTLGGPPPGTTPRSAPGDTGRAGSMSGMADTSSGAASGAMSGAAQTGSSRVDTSGSGPAQIPAEMYTTTDSGLKYYALREGSGASPSATDRVRVHYTGWLQSNGEKFDSSYDRGEPAVFPLNRVIEGWTEGLQQMQVGGKWQFVIPPDLAYGRRGRPGIPANSTLVFEVELMDVNPG